MATILIVDDLPDNLYVLERLLRGQGYDVRQAAAGEAALEVAQETNLDLVLLDVMMPGIDGFEVLRRLRDNARTQRLPVILLTANAPDQRRKIQGLNLGADEYLTQPINNSELLARVRSLLRSKQVQDELSAVNGRLQALLDVAQASTSTLDLAEVGERVVRGALQAAGMDVGGIWLCDGLDLVLLTEVGYADEVLRERRRIMSGTSNFSMEVLETRQPVYGETSLLYGADDPFARDITSIIILPLHHGEERLGVLQLGAFQHRSFTQADIDFLRAIANSAGAAVQNARLFAASQQSRQQLESVNEEKDEFISIISHELKNPLASIKGYASLLQRRARSDESLKVAMKGLDVIEQQVGRMSLLLDQLRDVTNIGINRFAIEPTMIDLAVLVERVASEVQATNTDHEIVIQIEDVPLLASADELRIGQVLNNLLGNAIKYSDVGKQVEVRVERMMGANAAMPSGVRAWACVDVVDHGIGIEPAEQERLFERFFRAENAKSKASGMGLGLYIAREIIALHGGAMWVTSKPDVGSTFSFGLPLSEE
ncbi:MAG: hypothetical protein NVSMB42_00480 [Herpetosiphon sp.]